MVFGTGTNRNKCNKWYTVQCGCDLINSSHKAVDGCSFIVGDLMYVTFSGLMTYTIVICTVIALVVKIEQ